MKKVLLLLAEGFETFEASVFIDIIGWGLDHTQKSKKLYTCGLRRELNSTFSQIFITDFTIDEVSVDDYDAVAIPGGYEIYGFYKDAYDERFLEIIREFHRQNKPVASICVAALPVAKSGILKGKKGTTYNIQPSTRQQELAEMGAIVLDKPIVDDSNIITSWNPSTATGVAFLLLEKLQGKDYCDKIKKLMGFI